jgi:hypothetical protein
MNTDSASCRCDYPEKSGSCKSYLHDPLDAAHQANVLTLLPNVAVGLEATGADGACGFGIAACHFATEL